MGLKTDKAGQEYSVRASAAVPNSQLARAVSISLARTFAVVILLRPSWTGARAREASSIPLSQATISLEGGERWARSTYSMEVFISFTGESPYAAADADGF